MKALSYLSLLSCYWIGIIFKGVEGVGGRTDLLAICLELKLCLGLSVVYWCWRKIQLKCLRHLKTCMSSNVKCFLLSAFSSWIFTYAISCTELVWKEVLLLSSIHLCTQMKKDKSMCLHSLSLPAALSC